MITRRQKQVLDFVEAYLGQHGVAPTLEEIGRHLGVGSLATVHKHLRNLEQRGAIRRLPHQSRALALAPRPGATPSVTVPLLGLVAAGTPIEPVEVRESLALPEALVGARDAFALRVRGDSMIGDGILDGDIVVVESRADAPDGATVVALVRGEATVKKLARRRGRIHLLPANDRVEPIVARPEDVEIRGVVIGLLRRYR